MPSREIFFKKIFSFFGANALWLGCLALSVGSYLWYSRIISPQWLKDLLLHLATASFIAFFLDIFFEYNFRLRHLEKWGSDVLKAVAGTMVPPGIVKELVAIMKSDIVRNPCIYTLEFLAPPPDAGDKYLLLKRDLSYTALNTTCRRIPFEITSSVEDPSASPHTKHLKVKIGGEEITDLEITRQDGYEKLLYKLPGGLAPNAEVSVFVSTQELLELNVKQNSYILVKPCETIAVHPQNYYDRKITGFKLRMHHPVNDEMKPDDIGWYRFPHAVLPGQGFDILWELRTE